MDLWQALFWAALGLAGVAALYGLHRLCLWLEARGLLYYKHKKPSSSAASCFVALQQFLEPPAKHVLHVKEEKRHPVEEAAGGPGEDNHEIHKRHEKGDSTRNDQSPMTKE